MPTLPDPEPTAAADEAEPARRRAEEDEAAALRADTADSDWFRAQRQPGGFFASRGWAAWRGFAPFHRAVAARIEAQAATLAGPAQVRPYRRLAAIRAGLMLAEAERHAWTERAAALAEDEAARERAALADLAVWGDRTRAARWFARGARAGLIARAAREGWDRATLAAALRENDSALVAARITRLAAVDPTAAAALLDRLEPRLLPVEQLAVRRRLERARAEERDRAEAAARDARQQAARQVLVEGRDPFDLAPDQQAALGPEQRAALAAAWADNGRVAFDAAIEAGLLDRARDDPAGLVAADLSPLWGRHDSGRVAYWQQQQQALGRDPARALLRRVAWNEGDRALEQGGAPGPARARATMRAWIDARCDAGPTTPTTAEIARFAATLRTPVAAMPMPAAREDDAAEQLAETEGMDGGDGPAAEGDRAATAPPGGSPVPPDGASDGTGLLQAR